MEIERVEYKNGRPFIRYILKTGARKNQICRNYGQIIICPVCSEKFFTTNSNINRGWGQFCSHKCSNKLENNPHWKNGKVIDKMGYILIKKPEHPFKNSEGYVREHRLIIEKQIGRYLHKWEISHHINGIKDDNRPENLMAFKGQNIHIKFENGKEINSEDIIFCNN
jgi:hypothetical protein